jgi:hypothetical protein
MNGVLGFDSRWWLGIFLFTADSITALVSTQAPNQWVPGALSLGLRLPGRKAYQSLESNAQVKECVELYLQSPNTPSWCGAQFKQRDNFTYSLPLETFTHRFTNYAPDQTMVFRVL